MKRIIFCLLSTVLMMFSIACDDHLYPDDEFLLKQKIYTDEKLKMNGYYCKDNCQLLFFYQNGAGLAINDVFIPVLIEDQIFQNMIHVKYKKAPWGLFEIHENTIKFEFYKDTNTLRLKSYIKEGVILNDTIFCITKTYRSDGSEQQTINDTFHFHLFSPKPDSTNQWIK